MGLASAYVGTFVLWYCYFISQGFSCGSTLLILKIPLNECKAMQPCGERKILYQSDRASSKTVCWHDDFGVVDVFVRQTCG